MSNYRDTWFKNNKGVTRPFRSGLYYKCVCCKKWYKKSEIDIDHRIPKNKGGTDDLWNLQPMCEHCNRSKQNRQSKFETLKTMLFALRHGKLLKVLWHMLKAKLTPKKKEEVIDWSYKNYGKRRPDEKREPIYDKNGLVFYSKREIDRYIGMRDGTTAQRTRVLNWTLEECVRNERVK